jgi:ribosomal protein S12 methylthiotransferase accessory factor
MDMKITFPGGKKVNAEIDGFTHKTDQSLISGGDESAPEPFSVFLSSIGTCTGIYVLRFCQERNINTTGMEIIQSMSGAWFEAYNCRGVDAKISDIDFFITTI